MAGTMAPANWNTGGTGGRNEGYLVTIYLDEHVRQLDTYTFEETVDMMC